LIAEDRERAAARRAAQKQEQMEALKETNGTPRKPPSQIDSNDQTSPSPTNSRDNEPESRTEYSNENIPSSNDVSKSISKTVQVSASKQLESKSDDKTPTIIDASFDEEGTETGRNLFAMLISES
jgi:hypothetical protein